MPGNANGDEPLFSFGTATRPNCEAATIAGKREAIHKLGMKPKHVKCRCASRME